MHNRSPLLSHALIFLSTCLILGCSKGDRLGCGSGKKTASDESSETALKGSSTVMGIYKVTGYQQSEGTCDQLVELVPAPAHLVLYEFEPNDGGTTRLGGAFCGDADLCRAVGKRAPEPAIGYSFISGDEASGWQGWAITETGSVEQKCAATVQSHTLTVEEDAIRIETKTVDVVFLPASEEDDVATCSNKNAIVVASAEEGCKSRLVLEATREADL